MIASHAGVLMGSFFTQNFFSLGFWGLDILLALALVGVVIVLATDDRDPSTVLAWLFVVLLLPVLGLLAYFFIGRNFRRDSPGRRRIMAQVDALAERSLAPVMAANAEFHRAAVAELAGTPGQPIESTGRVEGGVAPLPADAVDVFLSGAEKFAALLAEMAAAERYIHLMYLIWEQDELTAKVTDVLLDRLAAGVEVHILYDWLSCLRYKKSELKRLAAAGAVVAPCYKRLRRINYRNHMKMVIIDGEVGVQRRHEHGPGVHRRRPALRPLARHLVPHDRPGRRSLPPALRCYVAAKRRHEGPGNGVHAGCRTSITGTRAFPCRSSTRASRPPSRPSATSSSRRSTVLTSAS